MSWTVQEAERVRTIEVNQSSTQEMVEAMDKKLDELLALKNKGAGVLWVASILVTGTFTLFVSWITDLFHG